MAPIYASESGTYVTKVRELTSDDFGPVSNYPPVLCGPCLHEAELFSFFFVVTWIVFLEFGNRTKNNMSFFAQAFWFTLCS